MNVIQEFVYGGCLYQHLSNEDWSFPMQGFQRSCGDDRWETISREEYDYARKRVDPETINHNP